VSRARVASGRPARVAKDQQLIGRTGGDGVSLAVVITEFDERAVGSEQFDNRADLTAGETVGLKIG